MSNKFISFNEISSTLDALSVSMKDSNSLCFTNDTPNIIRDGKIIASPNSIIITYDELVALRDNNKLEIGQFYKIIDYKTTANFSNVTVANHDFDIIVMAIDTNKLSERAFASNRNTIVKNDNFDASVWNKTISSEPITVSDKLTAIIDVNKLKYNYFTLSINKSDILKINIEYISGGKLNIAGIELRNNNNTTIFDSDYHWSSISAINTTGNYNLQLPDTADSQSCKVVFFISTVNENNVSEPIDAKVKVKIEQIGTDNYFTDNIFSWEIKYCLDNNRNKYTWTDKFGKGVIYYMKDNYGNEANYDFKNILFRGKYTFNYNINNVNYDGSVIYTEKCYGNIIKSRDNKEHNYYKYQLSFNTFNNTSEDDYCYNNFIGFNSYNNVFSGNCYNNYIGEYCYNNEFLGNNYSNILSNNCHHNKLGFDSSYNKFNSGCVENKFGEECKGNLLEADCQYNMVGDNFSYNILKMYCIGNKFGNDCQLNILDQNCNYNILGNKIIKCKFGINCVYNYFCNYLTEAPTEDELIDCMENIILQNNCSYNIFYTDSSITNLDSGTLLITTTPAPTNTSTDLPVEKFIKNYCVCSGVNGTETSFNYVGLPELYDINYIITIANNTNNQLKRFCIADLL